jgi:hypothetical protein
LAVRGLVDIFGNRNPGNTKTFGTGAIEPLDYTGADFGEGGDTKTIVLKLTWPIDGARLQPANFVIDGGYRVVKAELGANAYQVKLTLDRPDSANQFTGHCLKIYRDKKELSGKFDFSGPDR